MVGTDSNSGRNETMYQMTDELYKAIVKYLKKNKISFKKMCKELNLPDYMTHKIMDRKIKMHAYRSYLVKIATYAHVYKSPEHFNEMQPKVIKYY